MPKKIRGISPKQYKELNFKVYEFPSPWDTFLGKVERNFHINIWGGAGQGKSTFTLRLANMLQEYGKVCYYPTEEKKSLSLQEKITRLNLDSKRLYFYPTSDLEQIEDSVFRSKPRFVIIDSAGDCGLSSKRLQDLKEIHKGRKGWVVIHKSKYRSNTNFNYDCGIDIEVLSGMAFTRKNRYTKLGKFEIFKQQGSLFNQGGNHG